MADFLVRAGSGPLLARGAGVADRQTRGRGALKASFRHSGTIRTKSYGVDAAFMQLERHERGTHVV